MISIIRSMVISPFKIFAAISSHKLSFSICLSFFTFQGSPRKSSYARSRWNFPRAEKSRASYWGTLLPLEFCIWRDHFSNGCTVLLASTPAFLARKTSWAPLLLSARRQRTGLPPASTQCRTRAFSNLLGPARFGLSFASRYFSMNTFCIHIRAEILGKIAKISSKILYFLVYIGLNQNLRFVTANCI